MQTRPQRVSWQRRTGGPGIKTTPGIPSRATRTRARVGRDRWSTPGTLRPKREMAGKAVQHHGPSGRVPKQPKQLIHPTGLRSGPESPAKGGGHRRPSDASARHPGQLDDPAGSRTLARVAWGCWSTLWGFRYGPEWPGASGRIREASGTVPSSPGQLVHHVGPRARVRVARDTWSTPWYV